MLNREEEKELYEEIDNLKKEIKELEAKVSKKRDRENLKERIYLLKRQKKQFEYELEGKDPSTVPLFF